ncbi:hypothetical protein [Luteimonas notoginsengisoli]|uniref:Uncharacterized protein n=1 Tax=Luteimonas notoginsengisoli TaxID=1578200 RepID=A0ABV7UXK3_9GAMM
MQLDDVLPQLERLSDAEMETALSAAGTDLTYRLQCACVFIVLVAAIGLFSLAVPRLYQAFHPPIYVRLVLAAGTLVAIWQTVKLVGRVVQHFYCRAITRHVRARAGAP